MATTYQDQLTSLNALTNSLVFENTTRAITGTNHNLQEIGQNESAYDNLVAYDNYTYKVVRTYGTNAANGTSLRDAYEDAKTLTPGGLPLSINNRVALLIPPGTYALGVNGLEVDTQFIDFIGLGRADETIITSLSNTGTGLGTITQTTNNVKFRNLTIQNDANTFVSGDETDDSAYAPQGVYPTVEFTDCIFRNPAVSQGAPFMRLNYEYSGNFIRCRGVDATFNSVFFPIASGFYFDCHYAGNGFGYNGEASGIFSDCSCLDGFGFNADASGSFTRCTAFNSGFGSNGNASGSFNYCTALTASFGWGDGVTCSGTFINCQATDSSFGDSTSAAEFRYCKSGDNSFGCMVHLSDAETAGTYISCSAGDNSFYGAGFSGFTATLSGTYHDCIAGNASFGGFIGGSIITGEFKNCTAGDNSFGQDSSSFTNATIIGCKAGNQSFGYNQVVFTTSLLKDCFAGEQSFGWAEFPATPSQMFGGEFNGCSGGEECWSFLQAQDDAKFIGCSAGINSFRADGVSGTVYLHGCTAGDGSFLAFGNDVSTFSNCSVAPGASGFSAMSGTVSNCYAGSGFSFDNRIGDVRFFSCKADGSAFNAAFSTTGSSAFDVSFTGCEAGNDSFFANLGSGGVSPITLTINGSLTNCKAGSNSFFTGATGNLSVVVNATLTNCHAGPNSFAPTSNSTKAGVMDSCSVRLDGVATPTANVGPLTGTMQNCSWLAPQASQPALIVGAGAKVYGGIYRAGAGAAASITSGAAVTASIANVLVNVALGGSITNNISSPNIIVDSDV